MIIGVPKEIKTDEYRVSMVPVGTEELVKRGHQVLVETQAGLGCGVSDQDYTDNGAQIVSSAKEIYKRSELIVKVKEPQRQEVKMLQPGQVIFTYFHFAANRELTESTLKSGALAIAYETVTDTNGALPLLTPMSEVAGKMSVQEGAKYLEKPMMGRGILLGGVPGVEPAEVLVLGGGVVGTNAAKVAAGFGASVTIMDINLDRLRYLSDVMPANVRTVYSNTHNIRTFSQRADLVIGAVLIPGARCPNLIPREYLAKMKDGAVIVDVGVDQGGCAETTKPTTHSNPTYMVDNVLHYCVANMPGAVSHTSTYALTNVTLPYVLALADKGPKRACKENPGLAQGINIQNGKLTNAPVGRAFGMESQPAVL